MGMFSIANLRLTLRVRGGWRLLTRVTRASAPSSARLDGSETDRAEPPAPLSARVHPVLSEDTSGRQLMADSVVPKPPPPPVSPPPVSPPPVRVPPPVSPPPVSVPPPPRIPPVPLPGTPDWDQRGRR